MVHERFADGDRSLLLLVDEDPNTLDTYRRYFECDGMSVAVATRPSDGHEHARRLRPDLLITEIRFGGARSGVDLVRAIRDDALTANIPIMLVTAIFPHTLPPDIQSEIDAVLLKPALPDAVLAKSRALILESAALRVRTRLVRERAAAVYARYAATLMRASALSTEATELSRRVNVPPWRVR